MQYEIIQDGRLAIIWGLHALRSDTLQQWTDWAERNGINPVSIPSARTWIERRDSSIVYRGFVLDDDGHVAGDAITTVELGREPDPFPPCPEHGPAGNGDD